MKRSNSEEWTAEETKALRKRLAEGKSFGQISAWHGNEIGGRTRSAIAGKCHREGLTGSEKGKQHKTRLLTDDQVEQIRDSDETGVCLAQRFGVGASVVQRVRNGDCYASVGRVR